MPTLVITAEGHGNQYRELFLKKILNFNSTGSSMSKTPVLQIGTFWIP
jgi:hypothetical protein